MRLAPGAYGLSPENHDLTAEPDGLYCISISTIMTVVTGITTTMLLRLRTKPTRISNNSEDGSESGKDV